MYMYVEETTLCICSKIFIHRFIQNVKLYCKHLELLIRTAYIALHYLISVDGTNIGYIILGMNLVDVQEKFR